MKATETAGYKYTSTTLYRVPTVEPYSGEESFAFVNPRLVSALQPDQIDIGEEFPATRRSTALASLQRKRFTSFRFQ